MASQSRPLLEPIREEFSEALATLEKVLVLGSNRGTDSTVRISLLNSVIVALVSTAEESLKDLFKAYLEVIEQNIGQHRLLPGPLQNSNLDSGIAILRVHIKENRSTAAALALQFAQCVNGGAPYVLFKDELTNNRGNFRSGQVTTIAKNVGLTEFWQQLSDAVEILDLTGEADLAVRTSDVIRRWNEVYDERDTIVHRISQANGWAEGRIRDAMSLFKIVINRVTVCLSMSADSLIEQHRIRIGLRSSETREAP